MKFILEPDASGEPIIWALEGGDTDNYQYTGILSRVDLHPDARRYWDDIVARMTGTTITNDDATVNKIMAVWTGDDWLPLSVRYRYALDVLAALTGVPHD